MVKITEVELHPLKGKHYSTEISAGFVDETGSHGSVYIEISGYHNQPSEREIKKGWTTYRGMDHVEGQAQYEIAKAIVDMLKGKSW